MIEVPLLQERNQARSYYYLQQDQIVNFIFKVTAKVLPQETLSNTIVCLTLRKINGMQLCDSK